MSPNYVETARIETMLMTEFLSPPDVRPFWKDAVWVENVPCGPKPAGIRRLQEIQEEYGSVNVTTGNPRPLAHGLVGVYVRPDVLGTTPNALRSYLSE